MLVLGAVLLLGWPQPAAARDSRVVVAVREAMAQGKAEGRLADDIRVFFQGQKHPAPKRTMEVFTAKRKTSGIGKSDDQACIWAFLASIRALQDRARKEGGNAVIDVKSFYGDAPFDGGKEFVCSAGNIMAGVNLEGRPAVVPH